MSQLASATNRKTAQDLIGNQELLKRVQIEAGGAEESWSEALPTQTGELCTRWGFALAILEALGKSPDDFATEEDFQAWASEAEVFSGSDMELSRAVNRAEAAKILVGAFNLPTIPAEQVRRTFSDVLPTEWYGPYIYGAVSAGLLQGYGDGTFNPGGNLESAYINQMFVKVTATIDEDATNDPQAAFDPTQPGMEHLFRNPEDGSRDQEADPETRKAQALANSVSPLDYQPDAHTYCNVFAADWCEEAEVFLPTIWWKDDIATQILAGGEVPDAVAPNITNLNASAQYAWLEKWGHVFGWVRVGTTDGEGLTQAQKLSNAGHVVVISATMGATPEGSFISGGHITIVTPETDSSKATMNGETVTCPVQSQAGAQELYDLGVTTQIATGYQWWERLQGGFPKGKAIWMHV